MSTARRSTAKDRVWPRMVISLLHDGGIRILAKPAPRVALLARFKEPEVFAVGPQMRPYLFWQLTKRETRALVRHLEEFGGGDASRLVSAIAKAQASGLGGCACF